MGLGILFALPEETVQELLGCADDEARLAFVEKLEGEYATEGNAFVCELDRAWDPIHRVLSDGELDSDGGEYPYSHAVLGGRMIYGDEDFILSLKRPEEVRDVARGLPKVAEETFKKRYFKIDAARYGTLTDAEVAQAWRYFTSARDFYAHAAGEGRFVLFAGGQ